MEHVKTQQAQEAARGSRPPASTRADSNLSILSADEDVSAAHLAADTAAHLARPLEVIAKAPMDLLLGVAQGFHNAPRLYGDDTVRNPVRITSLATGLKAAGSEFALGTYDAFTGVLTQPYRGARDAGVAGFVSGVGKGLGGLVLKEAAAVVAPLGFAMKGVQKEIETRHGRRTPEAFMRRARKAQGLKEARELAEKENGEVELGAAQRKVAEAWRVVEEVSHEVLRVKNGEGSGLSKMKGYMRLNRERALLEKRGAFTDVDTTKEAVMQRKLETGEGAAVA